MMVLRLDVFGKSLCGKADDLRGVRWWFVRPVALSLARKPFMRSHMCCWWCEVDGGLNSRASDRVGLGFGEHGDPSEASSAIDIGMMSDVNVNL
jgi:hypothetical protein